MNALAGALALALLALAGCAVAPARPPAGNANSHADMPADSLPNGVASHDGTYFVAFASRPSPIPANEEFALDVTVLAPDRRTPARDVALRVDANMPDHGHGMNVVPRVVSDGDGRFRVEGLLFHMSGLWEVEFDVTRGAVTERARAIVEID